jgi:hypothetical protein
MNNCSECARTGKSDGCYPDKCLPEFSLFVDPTTDPKKFCYRCSRKLLRQPSEKYSNECRKIPLKCPKCGIIGYVIEQFMKKAPKADLKLSCSEFQN